MGYKYLSFSLKSSTLALISFATLIAGTQAIADESSGRQIEEVIVTAERQEASIQDTSISITALTGDFLDDFGIRNQEDLQNFIPGTTIQPYDATVRGVGRNFRALGGDPGVATYINGVYSEDLLTATAQTFWDVERVEILRGPQGTLYGRNAVGGAINILYKQPTEFFEGSVKTVLGSFNTQDYYAAFSGPLVEDKLLGRITAAVRNRDGVIDEIGPSEDLDGLGTENVSLQMQWNPHDKFKIDIRQNWMEIDRVFGGANGGGLIVQNEEGLPTRNTTTLVPGYRVIDIANTDPANSDDLNFYDASSSIIEFNHPVTGAAVQTQRNRPGIDLANNFHGLQNAAASLDGFNETSSASAARYNACVFPEEIDGEDICAATNGENRELFDQEGTQFSASWDTSDNLQLKYIFGFNQSSYQRTTDDDNTASQYHDRQFYVNHEADYTSHELQAFWDISETVSLTTGLFYYDATIDQRGDFHTSLPNERRLIDPYTDNSSLTAAQANTIALAELPYADANAPTQVELDAVANLAGSLAGQSASELINGQAEMVSLFTAKNDCLDGSPEFGCATNFVADPAVLQLLGGSLTAQQFLGLNLHTSAWFGDDGTSSNLDVINGPQTFGSDLLYATQTEREAFAAYSQGVWDINELFSLTVGVRYAYDDVTAEENVFRYTESAALPASATRTLAAFDLSLADFNRLNGGLITDANNNEVATELATNGGVPRALSVYRAFQRKDEEVTGRVNLDWNVNDELLMYFSATSGYRSGGYNLVFFSNTPTYDPEELIAYEIGYKGQHFDNTLQLNASVFFYDYTSIHTTATEFSALGSTTTSVIAAPEAEVFGVEAEGLWLVNDSWTLGGNFSFTPSEYTADRYVLDQADANTPVSVFGTEVDPATGQLLVSRNLNGNQILQVPEMKYTVWSSYSFALNKGATLDVFGLYNWIDEVFYSPFESDAEKADAFGRLDFRLTYTSPDSSFLVSAFVNNILDEVGVLQVLRQGEEEFFRHTAGTTVPRMYGLEVTYNMGGS